MEIHKKVSNGILNSILLAQLAIPLIFLIYGLNNLIGIVIFTIIAWFLSIPISLVIAYPAISYLYKYNYINILTILLVALSVFIPLILILGWNPTSPLFLAIPVTGGVICWSYLKYKNITVDLVYGLIISGFIVITILSYAFHINLASQREYKANLNSHYQSYRALDKKLIEYMQTKRVESDKKP